MKKIYFLSVSIFFLSASLFAQDYKWSVEANYPFTSGSYQGDIDDLNGIVDLGIKYRFLDLGLVRLGVGINSSLFSKSEDFVYGNFDGNDYKFDSKSKKILVQPRLLGEFSIPGIQRLKPQVGLGYSVIFSDYYFDDGVQSRIDDVDTSGGVNLNLGLTYDITKRIFVQVQYDYIREKRKGAYKSDGGSVEYDFKSNVDFFKVGVGFRF